MKEIKLKSGTYKLNHFDYVFSGSVLFTLSKNNKRLLEQVPKKYYIDILFENHTVTDCGFGETIPSTIDKRLKGAKLITMDRWERRVDE